MNDTQQSPTGAQPNDDFDPKKLRSITDMRRSTDDRIIAGVCSGAARYLRIDPVVVRVVLAVLTLAGFAGAIIYIAAWLLLPSEDADKSHIAEWFNIEKNEEQVRVGGLIGAVVLAALAAVGDGNWSWWGDSTWWVVPIAAIAYFVWIRPRRKRQARAAALAPQGMTAGDGTSTQVLTRPTATPRKSQALLALTTSLTLIALAATWIYEETQKDIPWTTYVAVALGVVAFGLLIGTFFGHGGWLITIGVLLAATLAIGSAMPPGGVGEDRHVPSTAAEVQSTYQHGVGLLEIDLTQVDDLFALTGRDVDVRLGVGQTRILVPRGLNVDVTSHIGLGDITIFGRHDSDFDLDIDVASKKQPTMTIDIRQRVGDIEVIRK